MNHDNAIYTLTANDGFTASFTEKIISENIRILHLTAKSVAPSKLALTLEWKIPDVGINVCYSPIGCTRRNIRPDWGGFVGSSAMSSAPVFSDIGYDDTNRLTIACSDAKNSVRIRSGVVEETAELINTVLINVDCLVTDYECDVRLDTRKIPFYKCVGDVTKWWETYDGYTPIHVPDAARRPLYSAWYSFHRSVNVSKIIEECGFFSKLGCGSVIVDDGWQTAHIGIGYAYCGDWEPHPSKVTDMKAFVDAIHALGMKFILWYSVPYVGINSKAYERFKDKLLTPDRTEAFPLDPRYPEVRQYLIDIYRNALIDWGLGGFKLDFIDSFRQSAEVKDGMDYVSVYDAVDRLMKDVVHELTSVNPEILIEFRQSYIGPLMRTFGNMLRSSDCPNDSFTNRLNTLSLRMTSGNTAVHSDMVMWNYDEPVEEAAYQLTNIFFSVPQISVLHDRMPKAHLMMLRNYLEFWTANREVLLDGEMFYKNYASDFSYVSSKKDDTKIGAVYSGKIAYIENPTKKIVIFNASPAKNILIECENGGVYDYAVFDCVGEKVGEGITRLSGLARVDIPTNGRVEFWGKMF